MNYLFIIFAFISGLIGLSYEVIYQKIFLSIAGDLYGTYVAIVATFIIGMALGNFIGFRLRKQLALIEILNGMFAVVFAIFLKTFGYLITINYFVMIAIIALPAIAIGTNIPLYSYYFRKVKFKFIYALYHIGAVAAILFLEIFLFTNFTQSTVLLAIGVINIIIGITIFILYKRNLFVIISALQYTIKLPNILQNKNVLYLFFFSFLSFYYQFWAVKSIYYMLFPFRFISSLCIAASLFWIFVGSLMPQPSERAFQKYSCSFMAHLILLLFLMNLANPLTKILLCCNNYLYFFIIIFITLSPCLWVSAYFVNVVKMHSSEENVDEVSGILLGLSALANVFGFGAAICFSLYIDKPLYFAPFLVLLLLLIISSLKRKVIVFYFIFALLTLNVLANFDYNNLLKILLYTKMSIVIPNGVNKMQIAQQIQNENLKGTQRFISPGATITFIPNNGDNYLFAIDGYISNRFKSAFEYRVGFIPRLYFPKTIDRTLVIGAGTGETSSGASMVSKHTEIIEISPLIIKIMPKMGKFNNNLTLNPAAKTIQMDALIYLKNTNKKYNAIINTSTALYTIWAAKLYSEESLQLAKKHLTPDGIYETWIDGESISSPEVFLSYIKMLKKYFCIIDIHILANGYISLVAYNQPKKLAIFKYSDCPKKDFSFINKNKDWLPTENAINTHILRNIIISDDIQPMSSTLDKPTLEQLAIKNRLSFDISRINLYNVLAHYLIIQKLALNNKTIISVDALETTAPQIQPDFFN